MKNKEKFMHARRTVGLIVSMLLTAAAQCSTSLVFIAWICELTGTNCIIRLDSLPQWFITLNIIAAFILVIAGIIIEPITKKYFKRRNAQLVKERLARLCEQEKPFEELNAKESDKQL